MSQTVPELDEMRLDDNGNTVPTQAAVDRDRREQEEQKLDERRRSSMEAGE